MLLTNKGALRIGRLSQKEREREKEKEKDRRNKTQYKFGLTGTKREYTDSFVFTKIFTIACTLCSAYNVCTLYCVYKGRECRIIRLSMIHAAIDKI